MELWGTAGVALNLQRDTGCRALVNCPKSPANPGSLSNLENTWGLWTPTGLLACPASLPSTALDSLNPSPKLKPQMHWLGVPLHLSAYSMTCC